MKTLMLLLLVTSQITFAQLKKGQSVPDIQFSPVLNAPAKTATLGQLAGKLVLIEFWATWCGPCLQAMPHLNQLQQKHAQHLQIITVTDETPKRIQQYLTARPSNVWFAIDSGRSLSRLFPHQLIPHTVLIAPDGKLIAQTTPEAVTDEIIDSLWSQQDVHLPEKADNPLTVQEAIKTHFRAADTVQNRFIMQAEMKGLPGVRTMHANDSVFKNRRITCLNLSLTSLYRLAYGDFPYKRTIDKTGSKDTEPSYCLDLIVPRQDQLWPALQKELTSRFDVQAKIEPHLKDVNVLRIVDRKKFKQIPRNKSGQRTYAARQGMIDQEAITMADFADFLESFGTDKAVVIDETQTSEKLDIKFSFLPENPQSLTDILTNMGLAITKEQRRINMLVLYK